ncbi:MAG: DUF6198 family protein [Eggerthellales bacterium]|nr:DUF6198 family protein [Eggerthellales bacterium]
MKLAKGWHDFFDKDVPNLALRIVAMFVGLSFVAFSVALSRTTGLGTSVISCVPAVLSFLTPLSIGLFTFALNTLFVLAQVVLLRRDFKPLQLLCIPFVLVFSLAIDFFVPICQLIPMPVYPVKIFFSLVACFCTAFGVWIQVKAALIMLPGDGIVLTISKVFHTDFSKTKIAFDASNVIIGAGLSLITMGGLFGVREGTILMAVTVGLIIGLLNKTFPNIEYYLPTEGHITLTADDRPVPEEREPQEAPEPATSPDATC